MHILSWNDPTTKWSWEPSPDQNQLIIVEGLPVKGLWSKHSCCCSGSFALQKSIWLFRVQISRWFPGLVWSEVSLVLPWFSYLSSPTFTTSGLTENLKTHIRPSVTSENTKHLQYLQIYMDTPPLCENETQLAIHSQQQIFETQILYPLNLHIESSHVQYEWVPPSAPGLKITRQLNFNVL